MKKRMLYSLLLCVFIVSACATTSISTGEEGPSRQKKYSKYERRLKYNEVCYIDDGSCPDGEIKKITGGNSDMGILRKRECVKFID